MESRSATAHAPAAVGNVAVGFDVLGHAFSALKDQVRACRSIERGVRLVSITGAAGDLPREPGLNTAGRAVQSLVKALNPPWGIELWLQKGIPLGAGLGGSAASAVAAVVAANALFDEPLADMELLLHAVEGESVAAGARIADNVAPSLFGGLVLTIDLDPPRVQRIPVPARLRCVVVRPHLYLATREARALLRPSIEMAKVVRQTAHIAGLVAGCYADDLELIRAALRDAIIEPQRSHMIPGFAEVQRSALDCGALGCSISGAGPSLFAWCEESISAAVRDAMVSAFRQAGHAADGWIAPVGGNGAQIDARD